MKFLARREFNHLTPLYSDGEEALRKIKFGGTVTVEIKQPRNSQHHKLYWALVNVVFNNQHQTAATLPRYTTVEELHNALKVSAGVCTSVTLPSGTEVRIPGSIAFAQMDQTEFGQFFDKCVKIIAEHFLPGVDSEALKQEVQNMIGSTV